MFLVSFSFMLKLTFQGLPGRIILPGVPALFLILSYGYATMQSKTRIADWLASPELMLDTSVLLTIDVALQICFCILMTMKMSGSLSRSRRLWFEIISWFPGLLIFPVLFSMMVWLVFSFPGVDFSLLGWSAAVAVAFLFPLCAWLLKLALPESELRLELMYFINLIIAALGVVATVNGRTAAVGTGEVNVASMLAMLGLIAAGGVAGFFLNRIITLKSISRLS